MPDFLEEVDVYGKELHPVGLMPLR